MYFVNSLVFNMILFTAIKVLYRTVLLLNMLSHSTFDYAILQKIM